MSLYNRADRDEDLDALEIESQRISQALAAGTINGFQAKELGERLAIAERRIRFKLVKSGLIAQDISLAKRNMQEVSNHFEPSTREFKTAKKILGRAFAATKFNPGYSGEAFRVVGEPLEPSIPNDPQPCTLLRHTPDSLGLEVWRVPELRWENISREQVRAILAEGRAVKYEALLP